jgi:hypothetical protein
MPEWGSEAGSPDRRSRGHKRIPYSILDGEELWKGGGDGGSARGRLSVWAAAQIACCRAAGSAARMSVTHRVAAGSASTGGSPQGSDRSLEVAHKG